MPTIMSSEGDYQVIMDILADLPEHVITAGARSSLDQAQRATRSPDGELRIIAFPGATDSGSLRELLEDFLKHAAPMGARKGALRRLIPQLLAAR